MRLPTFYEQNLIPNWGIYCSFIYLLLFVSKKTHGVISNNKAELLCSLRPQSADMALDMTAAW